MGVDNKERISETLESLRQGLYTYVEQRMQTVYVDNWIARAATHLRDYQKLRRQANDIIREDVSALLTVVNREWDDVFRSHLSQSDRALINELIEVRNQWAHGSTFSTDDTYRAIDSVIRLLRSISAPQSEDVEKQRQDVLRLYISRATKTRSTPHTCFICRRSSY